MRLAILSPLNRSGCSVVATAIAQAAAMTQEYKTVLTYTSKARTLPTYLNLKEFIEDKTRSISLIVKLKRARAIGADELNDFLIKVSSNFYLMDTVSESITEEEALDIQKYIFTNVEADLVLCDISEAIDDESAQELMNAADAVCYVLNPDQVSVGAFKVWMESEYWPKDKPFFVVINKFDEEVIGVRPYSKMCGVATRNICKLHYNPYIVKACNESFLADIVPYAVDKDIRLLNIRPDLKELMSWITSQSGHKLKWEN